MNIHLRYGKQGLDVELPDANVAHVLRLNELPVISDASRATREALANPIACGPLSEVAQGRRDACIVVSDITRPVPNAVLLEPMLDTLEAAGIPSERTLVLIATGLHRVNAPEEWREMGLGEALERGVRVENHEARDLEGHAHLGETSLGIPAWVDRRYLDADLRILTGLVEPHLMAGYSGGRKAICPGLCAAETIMRWHGPAMLEMKEARAGNLAGNKVHQQALEVARMAGGADMIANVTLDELRKITGVYAGEMQAAHLAAMEQAERQTKVTLDEPVDIVVTSSAGHPLDLTFYQGTKGMVGALPIVKPGGTIVIAQENSEGVGGPEFVEMIFGVSDLHEHIQSALRDDVSCIDQWQLHEQEKVLRRCEVYNYSTGIDEETQRKLFVEPVGSVEEGVERALAKHGPEARIAVIPKALMCSAA